MQLQMVVAQDMADLCIIYASPRRKVVEALDAILSSQWSVWWDDKIAEGDYRGEIERQLAQAKCVIPVWCRVSRSDEDVIDEAEFARKRRVPLIPVRVDDVDPPLGFGGRQRVDLFGWDGDPDHPAIELLKKRIASIAPARPRLLPRPATFEAGGKTAPAPVFFHSVSSHETQLRPDAAVRALSIFGARTILVSAYDTADGRRPERMVEEVQRCRDAGAMVLLDSGNYEASRKADKSWSADAFHAAMALTPHDLAFCFDEVEAPPDAEGVVRNVVAAVERDSKRTSAPVLPIVHAPRSAGGAIDTGCIPELLRRIARELTPPLLAIPERELGSGIVERARTVLLIRRSLDELGFHQPLHLLGTGNPITIAVLAAAGADSFDGLEWCRVVADHEDGRMYHFHHYDFFAYQSEWVESPITRAAVASDEVNYVGKAVFHNLAFFSEWMNELQERIREGKVDRFLSEKLPKGSMRQLEQALPGVL